MRQKAKVTLIGPGSLTVGGTGVRFVKDKTVSATGRALEYALRAPKKMFRIEDLTDIDELASPPAEPIVTKEVEETPGIEEMLDPEGPEESEPEESAKPIVAPLPRTAPVAVSSKLGSTTKRFSTRGRGRKPKKIESK